MKLSIFILVVVLALTVNGSPINFEKRRFGQEHSVKAEAVYSCMKDQAKAANLALQAEGQGVNAGIQFEATAGALVNQTVFSLLANAAACDQQKAADACLDLADGINTAVSGKQGQAIASTLTDCCKNLRQLERNTNAIGKKSEDCKEKPKHKELDGLKQAQDPSAKESSPEKPKKSKPTATEDPKQQSTEKPKKKEDPKQDPAPTTTPTPVA